MRSQTLKIQLDKTAPECAIAEAGWQKSEQPYESQKKSDKTNPLLPDLPRASGDACKGEFFILPEMVKEMIEAECGKDASPAICEYDSLMNDVFCRLFTKEEDRPLNLLIFSTSSEHSVAVRAIPRTVITTSICRRSAFTEQEERKQVPLNLTIPNLIISNLITSKNVRLKNTSRVVQNTTKQLHCF